MKQLNFRHVLIIVALGLLGWALCGAIMFAGMSVMSIETTLIVHAIGAPVIFSLLSVLYFKKFRFTSPLLTAIAFLLIFLSTYLTGLILEVKTK